ncbi:MAG: hypothetical protein IKV59_03060 [Lachnospiraceae bacterium]|nr:hypothetical protein [Lachnospiraceae bacterium]
MKREKMSVCPYCFGEISRENIAYWIRKEDNERPFEDRAYQLCNEREQGEDRRFRDFWSNKDLDVAGMARRRIVLTRQEIRELLQNGVRTSSYSDMDAQEEDLERFFLYDGILPVAEAIPVCENCHNVLREDYFSVPTFHIAMYAPKATGKTSFLCGLNHESVMSYGNMKHLVFGHEMTFEYLREEEPFYQEFFSQMHSYEEGKDTIGSANIRNMPMSCLVQNQGHVVRLFFHDVSGELLSKRGGVNEIRVMISKMDALMLLMEATKEDTKVDDGLWQSYLDKCRILSAEEQMYAEREEGQGCRVEDLLPQKVQSRKSMLRDMVYQKLLNEDILKRKQRSQIPVAVFITKGDRLDQKYQTEIKEPCQEPKDLVKKQRKAKQLFMEYDEQMGLFCESFGEQCYGVLSAYGREPGEKPMPWGIRESMVSLVQVLKRHYDFVG